jgi:hypothetical protein
MAQRRQRTCLLLGTLAALITAGVLITLKLGINVLPILRTKTENEWPEWAYKARLAGIAFDSFSEARVEAKLQSLAHDNVSVVVVDAPTGWSYTSWEDDDIFNLILDKMRKWYLTGLELICPGCKGRTTPGTEHPDWMQLDINGNPIEIDGHTCTEFWLNRNDVDSWASPESVGYRDFYESRIRNVAASGVDGIWVDVIYLVNSMCAENGLWPSYDEASRTAFEAAYGYTTLPGSENWNDLKWRKWIHWRYETIRDFIDFIFSAARDENPDILCFTENWNIDTNYATWYGQDPLALMNIPYVATVDELCSYNQDCGGMNNATFQNWRDYAFMAKFSMASDNRAPSWILTYASNEDISRRVAGVMVAEKSNFYETRGPEMLDTTAGGRAITLGWIKGNEDYIYDSDSMADIAIWYSPESRDYVDQGANDNDDLFYEYSNTIYMKEFRAREKDLMMAWMPFDIVVDEGLTLSDLREYEWLVLPNAACLSDNEAQLIGEYAKSGGKVVVTMDTGDYDEWYQPRSTNALAGITTYTFSAVTSDLLDASLSSIAKGQILAEVRCGMKGGAPFLIVPLVNFKTNATQSNFMVDVRLPDGFIASSVRMTTPDGPNQDLSYLIVEGGAKVRVTIPSLDTTGLIIIEDTLAMGADCS